MKPWRCAEPVAERLVLVDDLDGLARPAQRLGTLDQGVLPARALAVIADLMRARLADVDDRLAAQVPRPDLGMGRVSSHVSPLCRAGPEAEGLEDHAGEAMAEPLAVGQRELEPDLVQGYVAPRERPFEGRRRAAALPQPVTVPGQFQEPRGEDLEVDPRSWRIARPDRSRMPGRRSVVPRAVAARPMACPPARTRRSRWRTRCRRGSGPPGGS